MDPEAGVVFEKGDSEFREGMFRVPAKVTLHTPSRTQKDLCKSFVSLPGHSLPEMFSAKQAKKQNG